MIVSLYAGEIHVVLGENGAGKSSLAKILCGLITDYEGAIYVEGKRVLINTPLSAQKLGIASIQQECLTFDKLTVAENIFANNPSFFGTGQKLYSRHELHKKAQILLDTIGYSLDAREKVENLNLAEKSMMDIARISALQPKILILDEPGSSLNQQEIESFCKIINQIKEKKIAVMIITHRLEELKITPDRLTIMRDGKIVSSGIPAKYDSSEIRKKTWGAHSSNRYPRLNLPLGKELFCVENLSTSNLLYNISFSIREGEIVGIAGLVGSGRSQIAKTIIGQYPHTSGTFYIDRLKAIIKNPKDAIDYGIAFVTEDRYNDGLFLNLDILRNVFSVNESQDEELLLNNKLNLRLFNKYQKKVNLSINNPFAVSSKRLSGGMQQKLILLRWLLSSAKIFIFDEPTRGVDIASKVDIYNLMNDLTRKKAGILLISSSFEELIGMCDTILILKDGTISHKAHRSVSRDFETLYEYII